MERMAKAIGTDAKAQLMEVERRVRANEAIPAGATGITLGIPLCQRSCRLRRVAA